MNRRSFLKWLGGTAAAVALTPSALAAAQSLEKLGPVEPEAIEQSLRVVTMAIATRIQRTLPFFSHVVDATQLGQAGLTHQYNVDLILPSQFTADTVNTVADELSSSIRASRLGRFGEMSVKLPDCQAVSVKSTQFCMRGIIAYNVMANQYRVRFDLLGGTA